MSVALDILRPPSVDEVPEPCVEEPSLPAVTSVAWDPEIFAREQIRGLVRQIFLPGEPKPARQVVFSSIDPTADVAEICALVGKDLAAQISGNVCLVEASAHSPSLEFLLSGSDIDNRPRLIRSSETGPKAVGEHLWLMSAADFLRGDPHITRLSVALTELRRDFEYAIIHAPLASLYSEPALLAHLADGIILVLQANCTRRITAQRTIQNLRGMNARLLGTVLNQRTFPIPERLYRRI